jgi:hypothetical protein
MYKDWKKLGSFPRGSNLTVDETVKPSGYARKWMIGYRIRLTYVIAQLIPSLN